MRVRLVAMAAGAVLAGSLAACGGGAGSAASGGDGGSSKIKVGYPSDTASYGDLYVCQDEGIFTKHGLDVELTLLKTSSQLLAALSSGSVQIAGGDGKAVAAGALKGADMKVVELKIPAYFVEMWGKSDITSVDALKGHTVGVTAPGSVTDSATRIMLKDKGLDKDVKVTNLTSRPALIAAAQKGAIDALVTAPPQGAETQTLGWHKITDMTQYKTAASVYAVKGSYAQKNGDVVKKFVAADVECLNYLQKNPDKSIDAIAKHTKTDDRELAKYAYEFFKKIWVTDPTVDTQLIEEAFSEAAKGGSTPDVSKFIDNSYVKAASS
jgi:NitT/TauT family transport system substrate-binding protein